MSQFFFILGSSSLVTFTRLRGRHIRPRRPAIRPMLLPRNRAARLTWCRRHLRFRRKDWANILFTDESCFHCSDGRYRVYRHVGERYADQNAKFHRSAGSASNKSGVFFWFIFNKSQNRHSVNHKQSQIVKRE
jgi:hypothetical protein